MSPTGYKLLILIGFLYCTMLNAQVPDTNSIIPINEYPIYVKKIDKGIHYYKRNNRAYELAHAYEKKAESFENSSYGVAINYYEKAFAIYDSLDRETNCIRMHECLLNMYYRVNEYEQALTHSYELLAYYEAENDTDHLASTYNDIASLYHDLHNNEKSIEFYQKALACVIAIGSDRGVAAICNNIASNYQDIDSLDLAFAYIKRAEEINQEMHNTYWLSINYRQYAEVYALLGMYDSTRHYLFKSHNYVSTEGTANDSLFMLRKLGVYYLDVDSSGKALEKFNQGILLSRRVGNLWSEANYMDWISELYERQGDMGLALSFKESYYDLMDSLRRKEKDDKIAEYETLYEVQNLESNLSNLLIEKELLSKESIVNRNRFYTFLSIAVLFMLGAVLFYLMYKKQARTNAHLLKLNVEKVKKNNQQGHEQKKYAQSNLTEEKKVAILTAFMVLMKDQKIYMKSDLSLASVAQELDVSRSYLSQVINETYSQSFTAYINTCRIEQAKAFLLADEYDKYSINGIAEIVGFKSISAFNTAFKKNTGLTPSYYRKHGKQL